MPSNRSRRLLALLLLGPLAVLVLGAATPSPRALATPLPGAELAQAMGYAPEAVPGHPGMFAHPEGDCSTPTGATVFGFEDACREHDLAYDVLRFRAASGKTVGPSERWSADARFALRLSERCAELEPASGLACLATASAYATGVALNSLRQTYGPPVEESWVELVGSSLALLGVLAVPFAPLAGARAFRRRLRREDAHLPRPTAGRGWSGEPGSRVRWADLGREGRRLLSRAPVAPGAVRVLVSVDSARSLEDRVALALAEAERTGAFSRGTVCVAVPTGSGWLNPHAVESLERAAGGDVALVSVAYAAAPSWLSVLAHPGAHRRAAQALLRAVHARARELPEARRPRLVVHGESLGANAMAQALEREPEVSREVAAGLLVGGVGSARWGEVLGGRVHVTAHEDDPVARLHAVPRVGELLALRGAASAPLGSGHRYGPELEKAWRAALAVGQGAGTPAGEAVLV